MFMYMTYVYVLESTYTALVMKPERGQLLLIILHRAHSRSMAPMALRAFKSLNYVTKTYIYKFTDLI